MNKKIDHLLCLVLFISTFSIFIIADTVAADDKKQSFADMVIGEYTQPIPDVFHNNFSHYSEAEPLVNLLETFARSQGLRAAFTENVKGEVSGRFTDLEPIKFLAGIYTAFGVEWYVLDDILHFYVKRDLERRLVYLSASEPSEIKKILVEAGLISMQLPCNVNDEKNVIIFSGPSEYTEGVAAAIKSYEDAYRNEQEVKVFFLKHAWADDTKIGSGKDQKVIPGVASILKEMILKVRQESAQLAVGTGKGAAIRDTIPPEEDPYLTSTEVTLEQLRQEAKEQMELDRKVASPMHTEARKMPKVFRKEIAPVILADSRSNSVIVRDAKFRMPYYEKTIAELDKPLDLVEIHAAIVDVDTDYSRSLGVDLAAASHIDKYAGIGAGSNVTNVIKPGDILGSGSNPASIAGPGFNFSTVYSFGSDYFLARVDALEVEGNARVLGRPSVLTIDNTSASLDASTTFYIRVVGTEVVELKEVSSGTSLTVTPHIVRYENEVPTIKLAVSIVDGAEPSTGSIENDIPAVVKKTTIDTQGYIPHGQSLLIGGYYYEKVQNSDSGVPILKTLPGLGNLFKTVAKDVQRMERMILITPKIINIKKEVAQKIEIDEDKFFRSPFSTDSGGVTELQPVQGCTAKRAGPQPVDFYREERK